MWQELCKTREEYLERAKLDTKGYSPRRSETLLYEIARLDGMDIKKQDFFNILNDIEISPKVTREDTHRIKDLSNAFWLNAHNNAKDSRSTSYGKSAQK